MNDKGCRSGSSRTETGLDRQSDGSPQPSHRGRRQFDIATMVVGNIPSDGQPKSHAAGLRIAGFFEPLEGAKDLLALILRDTRAVIVNGDLDLVFPQVH